MTIEIKTDFIKLDSLLKLSGVTMSGGEAKEAIQAGEVLVDGEVCTMRGRKIRPGMTVTAGGVTMTVTISSRGERP
ncbi:MAG TPA: RNA-binding S4 domain-containing protein [Candidatus Acidoferrum sp.]|nr:RNA-binding S4 domain-containing protein [Candidatus Acidoferrum sp.]